MKPNDSSATLYDLSDFTKWERRQIEIGLIMGTEDGVRNRLTGPYLVTEAPQRVVLSVIRAVVRDIHQGEIDGDIKPKEPGE